MVTKTCAALEMRGRRWFDWRSFGDSALLKVVPVPRYDPQFLVSGFAPPSPLRVLELGCGKGLNAKFFAERGDEYVGIDREPRVLPGYRSFGTFLAGDFTRDIPNGFDLIFDRAGFAYNSNEALARTVSLILTALKGDGIFIAADLYAAGHVALSDAKRALRSFTLDELQSLFSGFKTLHLERRQTEPVYDFVGCGR
jgi:SAM-dependent methyltransferase